MLFDVVERNACLMLFDFGWSEITVGDRDRGAIFIGPKDSAEGDARSRVLGAARRAPCRANSRAASTR